MKALTKYLAGAAAAAALTVTAASPAQAQWHDRDDDIDMGDIVTGVAVVGGIAAILGAFSRDGDRYGYDNRYRYRDDYRNAVNACSYEAERYAQGGRVSITDIDRRSNSRYRVRGVVDAGYGNYGGTAGYDPRYNRGYDPRYNRGYDRNNRRYDNRYAQRVEFECDARSDGRITDFDVERRRY
jgi:hypothetical protein